MIVSILLFLSALVSTGHTGTNILVTNNYQCTRVGRSLFDRNATIEQIYVAVSLCEGVVHPMDSGLGGGFQGVLYDGHENRMWYLMSREQSPLKRTFVDKPLFFGNSVGVPAVMAGYAKLLGIEECLVALKPKAPKLNFSPDCVDRIAKGANVGVISNRSGVPYRSIFTDVIDLARNGFYVSPTFASVYRLLPNLGGSIPMTPDNRLATNPTLANYLEMLSRNPLHMIDPYVNWENREIEASHDTREIMLRDLRFFNSDLNETDFTTYRAELRRPIKITFRYRHQNYTLITLSSPGGGEPVAFFFKMMETIKRKAGTRGVLKQFNFEQRSLLFTLCSKYSYAVKPYFRQLSLTDRYQLINYEAPRIADHLYTLIKPAKTEEALVRAYESIPGIPRTFGRRVLPDIQVASVRLTRPDESAYTAHGGGLQESTTTTFSTTTANIIEMLERDTSEEAYEEEETEETSPFNSEPSNLSAVAAMIDQMNDTTTPEEEEQDEYVGGSEDNPFGTTNVVIRQGKRSIVATSSINHSFGSGILSKTLGIFYNNVLRDFTPNTWYQRYWLRNGTKRIMHFPNDPHPHSIPQSSMAGTILISPTTHVPVFGIGGAGGFKITGAVFNVAWNYFILGNTLDNAVARLRIITKINYKTNRTEIWYEVPAEANVEARSEAEGGNSKISKKAGLRKLLLHKPDIKTRPHAPGFFFENRRRLNAYFIKEAGYSAITAYSTMRGRADAAYDNRRGGRVFVKT